MHAITAGVISFTAVIVAGLTGLVVCDHMYIKSQLQYHAALYKPMATTTSAAELLTTEREKEIAVSPIVAAAPPTQPPAQTVAVNTIKQASRPTSANLYSRGYCTWYVKSKRPDLPNNLGNANTWVIRARAQGLATGPEPRSGAIGQRGMHVVYVESVNGNGTITISEMNYRDLYIISRRTLPANYFTYIY